ncbi:MAG: Asp-tRNA(Asn)/Glu-tRNA(Gln) amidotransferase subunit GatC [candidate division Zixibacteria bacterium]|jgi:aspartyl-tRNA(Asn)/glutamyl-tRNA(Gln) amidotransferase subunit C|nr:Asp-tRNA(Asn)/Glu-tRNA(Gln) amidotransferase subunit GatC [candidate division Zixibacteria bacterium]
MAISKEEVEHIARLAGLQLSSEEIVKYQAEFSSVLDCIMQLKQVDASGIDSTVHNASNENTIRVDKMGVSLPAHDALANAPARVNNMSSIPKDIDN